MNTPDPVPPVTINWWESKIIRRLALSIVVQLLAVAHLSKYVAGIDLSGLVDNLLELAGIAYAAWAVHARVTKPVPPITEKKP
jgi:hypothetical protein